ncbi:MAG: sensor histidine kinase [Paracoccaceae bacterium]
MTAANGRPIVQRLGFQIAFLLAVVLLPLSLISMVNSVRAISETRARSEAALTGETLMAAANEVRMIQEARGSAAVLALTIEPLLSDDAACTAALRSLGVTLPQYAQISYIPLNGQVRCSSTGQQLDISQSPLFKATVGDDGPGLAVSTNSPISGVSILAVSNPVHDDQGTYLGYVFMALPHRKLDMMVARAADAGALQLMTFDSDGELLIATGGLSTAANALPKDRKLTSLLTDQPLSFSGLSEAGDQKVYSVVPLVPGELFLLGTWPAEGGTSFDEILTSIPLLFPALIWIASLVVAWLAVEGLVNRHIRRFNTAIKSFAAGNRMTNSVDVAGAPLEIREMAAAYELMTDAVMRDEAELEDALHQKEVLMREVHHRVKNNLQMIASIMNMHLRKARTPETLAVIKGLQSRVMSLATIHRELYQTSGVSDVHAAELLDAIARQTVNVAAGPDRSFDLRMDLDDIRMTPDQAVPLALLVGEGLMNGVKFASASGAASPLFELSLTRLGPESAVVAMEVSVEGGQKMPTTDTPDDTGGLSAQLMAAFSLQLGGKLENSVTDSKYTLRAHFNLRPLIEAEDRHATKSAEPA